MSEPAAAQPGTGTLLRVAGLWVRFDTDTGTVTAVGDVSFDVAAGEVVALVGESGSGKSVSSLAVMGLLPRTATVGGQVWFDGQDLLALGGRELRRLRGSRIAMVFQDAAASLDPVFTVGSQLGEIIRRHDSTLRPAQVRAAAVELLRAVELPEAEARLSFYPHQLSGGQCQRVMIAMAIAGRPDLLIADEPTTALDVTVQAEILGLLHRLRSRLGMSILMITHDMGVVADIADRVVVLNRGEVVETAETVRLFSAPARSYTRQLLAAVPALGSVRAQDLGSADRDHATLQVRDLVVRYRGRRAAVTAVDHASLEVAAGEIHALVGESGSGKSTIGKAVVGLAEVAGGSIDVCGVRLDGSGSSALRSVRQRVGIVFQNPARSLNPRYRVSDTLAEGLIVHRGLRGSELVDRVDELLRSVGLGPQWRHRYPHELSGGQRQRVAIARAISLDPDLLIADEPTSALDVSVQARVLDVFRELQSRLRFACLFISHDLAVVDSLSDRVTVLRSGRVVEHGTREAVLRDPVDPYTRRLIQSAPLADPVRQRARRAELDAASGS